MRPIDADALKETFSDMYRKDYERWIKEIIDNAPTITIKDMMRAEENDLYREETCDRKSHCTDYEYWHCIGCNGCKRREANNETN